MRVGIVSTNEVQRSLVCELLSPLVGEVAQYDLSHARSGELEKCNAHILIIDLSDPAISDSEDVMDLISMEEPVCLLHERDLYAMGQEGRIAWRNRTVDEIKKALPDLAAELENKKNEADNRNTPDAWIIGASTGGPTALRDFFAHLPILPISIFVAQHISEDAFTQMLSRLRDIAPKWSVQSAENGAKVQANSVYLVPRDRSIEIRSGAIVLKPYSAAHEIGFNPCIDAVIRSMFASHPKIGVIIMSGMGRDGSAGIRAIKGKAKMILAQDHGSCGAKSMPDSARETGAVQASLPPEGLAAQLARMYGQSAV